MPTLRLRRIFTKKRRCLFFFSLCLITTFALSWFSATGRDKSQVVNDGGMPVDPMIDQYQERKIVEPKFNVLALPKVQTEKPIDLNVQKLVNASKIIKTEKPDVIELTANDKAKEVNVRLLLKNKTKDIEVVKNETLPHLGLMGVKDSNKTIPKLIFAKLKWNLSASFDDLGNVMKDTSFFNKLKPLDLKGPLLESTRNRTANFSFSMPLKMGYCDCWELYCFCCVQIVNERLHINAKACANFTFFSKSHRFDLTFSVDGKRVHKEIISADAPPLLCMGSIPAVADMCVHFFNMTYKVDRLGMHKSQLLGCTDFSLNVYNKTINSFPVDCFQIPGDPDHHPKHEQIVLPNFVP